MSGVDHLEGEQVWTFPQGQPPEPPNSAPQAMKDVEGKLRHSLLIDEFIEEMTRVREFGAEKYEDWDWLRGRDWSDYADAIKRHLIAWSNGEPCADDSGCHHMAHIAVNAMFLYVFEVRGLGNDNRPGVLAERILALLREADDMKTKDE